MSSQSALSCHGSAFCLLNRTHLWSHVTDWPHTAVEHFCCGSHSVKQSSCRIQRPNNQRCLLPTAFKDSSVRTTVSAPECLARARFVYDYVLYKFTFIIIMTRSSRFRCPVGVINKPTTVELWISPVCRRLAVAKICKSTMLKLLTWPWRRPLRECSLITRLRLRIANPCTRFEVSSFSRCRDFTSGAKILKRVSWPWPRPFQGRFFFGRVGLAMVSQCTKFEVSRFTRYEAINGVAKCRKWGG